MRYSNVVTGTFVNRPNRFMANVRISGTGSATRCHVKNTGRCKELLVPGATVVLAHSDNPTRKTAYDLIAVYKGDLLINMDSQAPNTVVGESIEKIIGPCASVRAESVCGESRFDFRAEKDGRPVLIEVKGVTLENDGHVLFPDAPTERGLKHVRELTRLAGEG